MKIKPQYQIFMDAIDRTRSELLSLNDDPTIRKASVLTINLIVIKWCKGQNLADPDFRIDDSTPVWVWALKILEVKS